MSQLPNRPDQGQGNWGYPPPRPPAPRNYKPPKPSRDLPTWVYAILVFATIFVVGMVVIIVIAISGKQEPGPIVNSNPAPAPTTLPSDCFNSSDLVFQNQMPTWNGIVHKEGTRLCIQGKISKVTIGTRPTELYFYPSNTNPESNSTSMIQFDNTSYLALRVSFELSFVNEPLSRLKDQIIRIRSFTDHNPRGWFIPIRDYDWFEVVSKPELKVQIKP